MTSQQWVSWWTSWRDRLRDLPEYPSFHDYPERSRSPEWIAQRKQWVIEWFEANDHLPTCCVCNRFWTLADDLHHVTYMHLGDEYCKDLVPLCHEDHVRVHELFEMHPEVLYEGRIHATTRAINQLYASVKKERREHLIAAAKGENE